MTKAECSKQWRERVPGGYSLWQKQYRLKNLERFRERDRLRRSKNRDRHNTRQRELRTLAKTIKYLYGMTEIQYASMLAAQGNCCAICRIAFDINTKPYVDHDHELNQVRGLLCNFCNLGIGKFRESLPNLKRAVAYLEQPPTGILVNLRVHNWRKQWLKRRTI